MDCGCANRSLAGVETYVDADLILDYAEQVQAVAGPKVACVLAAWMGGAPEKAWLSLVPKFHWTDLALWWAGKPIYKYVVQPLAGAAGTLAGGGKIYTISDACPGGPSVQDALAAVAIKDPELLRDVVEIGNAHRGKLKAQLEKQFPDVIKAAETGADKAAGYVAAGAELALSGAGALSTILANLPLILLGAGALYLLTRPAARATARSARDRLLA